uniref:Uncharacterized protein n=1 Tax=Arundo donax TaxID=35708 RepID=A0A0A9C4K5_ARUDO
MAKIQGLQNGETYSNRYKQTSRYLKSDEITIASLSTWKKVAR